MNGFFFKNGRGPKLSRIPNYAFSFNRREIRNLLSEASDGRSLIRRIHCLDTSEETKAFLSIDAYNPKINNTSTPNPYISFLLRPRSPRAPQCNKGTLHGATIQATGLPNYSFWHQSGYHFLFQKIECFDNKQPEASEPAHIPAEILNETNK